jgi:SNF2 family DNA or RNA helicase
LTRELLGDEQALWPSQRKGIAQALQILDQQGSVLVADATGAGKTRMGAQLIGAVRDQIVRSNRLRHGTALMVCPPMVISSWEREKLLCSTALEVRSHGVLSHAKSKGHELTIDALRRAQILCVDEGHNFLNMGSSRTRHLLRNMADHVLLFTATPINKSAGDLLRIANMLGGDNLDDDVIEAFTSMMRSHNLNRSLTDDEVNVLRAQINRFTVRRTKRVLNKMVDEEPEKYRDYRGELCRYPEHNAEIYYLNEKSEDRRLANEINELAGELHAVTHFVKPVEYPEIMRKQGISEEQYLARRLNSANKLAHYVIKACLRSSRAALAEHIVGTAEAVKQFSLQGFTKQNATGNTLFKVQELAGNVPDRKSVV